MDPGEPPCRNESRTTLDPTPWVSEAEEAANALFTQSDDPLWQQRIKWELGLAYLNALRVDHSRRETTSALRYGQRAIDNLAEGAVSRQAVPLPMAMTFALCC